MQKIIIFYCFTFLITISFAADLTANRRAVVDDSATPEKVPVTIVAKAAYVATTNLEPVSNMMAYGFDISFSPYENLFLGGSMLLGKGTGNVTNTNSTTAQVVSNDRTDKLSTFAAQLAYGVRRKALQAYLGGSFGYINTNETTSQSVKGANGATVGTTSSGGFAFGPCVSINIPIVGSFIFAVRGEYLTRTGGSPKVALLSGQGGIGFQF